MARRDDPSHGEHELVSSTRPYLLRHYVLETDNGYMTACRGHSVREEDILTVEARHISCGSCRKYLNL